MTIGLLAIGPGVAPDIGGVSAQVELGLSVGWRRTTGDDAEMRRSASINPADSTLSVDKIDKNDVVVSGVAVVFPFSFGLGFIANVNLATFGGEGAAPFNQSIEGGGGLAYRFSEDFAIAFTAERAFSRRLRDFVKENEPLLVNGEALMTLDSDDDRFFIDDNKTALSFKFVYMF